MTKLTIKQGDTAPPITATLKTQGVAQDLTNAVVRFRMRRKGLATTTLVDELATIVNAAAGQVRYTWQAGDTDARGVYDAEWAVTYMDERVQMFPSDQSFVIEILPRITPIP